MSFAYYERTTIAQKILSVSIILKITLEVFEDFG